MNKSNYIHFLNLTVLTLISLIIRVAYNPLRATGNLYPDEAYYLVNSRNITEIASNPILLFRATSLLTYFLIYYLFGFSLDIFIWVNYLYGVLLTIAVYLIVLDITRKQLTALFSSVFITLSSFFIHASQSNLIDLPIAFWLLILYYFLYKTHYEKKYILPSIITMVVCIFTKETAFYAIPILIFINILFIKNYRIRIIGLILSAIILFTAVFLIGGYIEIRGYSNLFSIENAKRFIYNLGCILTTNFYILFNIFTWTYEKYLTIIVCVLFIFIVVKAWYYKRASIYEISLLFFAVLFYLTLLYVNPAKVALNIGWRYLLPSMLSLLLLFSVLITDSIYLVKENISNMVGDSISLIVKNKKEMGKIILTILLIAMIISLPVYYAFSELNFYNRYVKVTMYEYDSLRRASLIVADLKQDNESTILAPFIYQVSIWTDFKFEKYYSFPKNSVDLHTLLNETIFDYIIVSDWWVYHPFELIQEKYLLLYSITDAANHTTKIYKSI